MNVSSKASGHEGARGEFPASSPADRAREVVPRYEGLPLLSLLVAGALSCIVLSLNPFLAVPILAAVEDVAGGVGPLGLPLFGYSRFLPWLFQPQEVFGVALVGSLLLTIVSLVIHMVQQHRPLPDSLPYILSFPVAAVLIAPSALEIGGAWQAWLVFTVLAAGFFCLHWWAFTRARSIWD